MPILDNVLLEAESESICVTASDSQSTLRVTVKGSGGLRVDRPGRACVPAKIFAEILRTVPAGPVEISLNKDGTQLYVSWNEGSQSMLPSFDVDDYPVHAEPEACTNEMTINAGALLTALGHAIPVTKEDPIRPAMGCVLLDGKGAVAATDSHLLLCEDVPFNVSGQSDNDARFLLEKSDAEVLKSLLGGMDRGETVTLRFDAAQGVFTFDGMTLLVRTVAQKYPDYRTVIPSGAPTMVTVGRNVLVAALRRTALSADGSGVVKLDVPAGGAALKMNAEDAAMNIKGEETVPCSVEGEAATVGFKAGRLVEILSTLSCDRMDVLISGPRKAALLSPSEDEFENEPVKLVAMPVKVN